MRTLDPPPKPGDRTTSDPATARVNAVCRRLDGELRRGTPMVVGGAFEDIRQGVEASLLNGRGAVEALAGGGSGADADRAIAEVRRAFDTIAALMLDFSPDGATAVAGWGNRAFADCVIAADRAAHAIDRSEQEAASRALENAHRALVPRMHPGRKGETAPPLAGLSLGPLDAARRDLGAVLTPRFRRGRSRLAAPVPDPWGAGLNEAAGPDEGACRLLAWYLSRRGYRFTSWRTIQTALNAYRRETRSPQA